MEFSIRQGNFPVAVCANLRENSPIMPIDPAELRSRLETALAASQIDASELSRRIGRSQEYVRDFLRERKNSIKANELQLIEIELRTEPGFLTGYSPDARPETEAPILRGFRGVPPPRTTRMQNSKEDAAEKGHDESIPIGTPIYVAKEGSKGAFHFDNYPYDFVQRPWFFKEARLSYGIIIAGYSLEPFFWVNDIALINPDLPLMRGRLTLLSRPWGPTTVLFRIVDLIRWDDATWIARHPGDSGESAFSREEWPDASRVIGKIET